MKGVIINADDCGMSYHVNQCIENAILSRVISSSTIMANMDDFEGSIKLYNQYKDVISFGWHINLTEGKPLTNSQLLLDKGFYIEDNGAVYFNGQEFRKRLIIGEMAHEIKKELRAQCNKLRDYGVEITHADGHHHIHTAPSMFFLIPSLFNELRIKRCRRLINYGSTGFDHIGRQLWAIPFKIRGIRMPSLMGEVSFFFQNECCFKKDTIELECHPGHSNPIYQNEMNYLLTSNIIRNVKLITYKDI